MRVDSSQTIANQVKKVNTLCGPRVQQRRMSIPPNPSEKLLQCVQKQIMHNFLSTCGNLAICFGRFMSLSEHEKTEIMDDGGVGFQRTRGICISEPHRCGDSDIVGSSLSGLAWRSRCARSEKGRAQFPSLTCLRLSSECATTCCPTSAQGYECFGRFGGEVWCGLFPQWSQYGCHARSIRTPMS